MKFLKPLRPFFAFQVKSVPTIAMLLVGITVFALLIRQALLLEFTYDEAYTYLNLGRLSDCYKIVLFRIANNHVLNSILVTISTIFFPFNEMAIRIPSLLFGGLYILLSITFSRQYKNSFIAFGFFIFYYHLFDFFAQARGYGMAACIILAALFVIKNKDQFKQYWIWIIYLFILAFYANFVSISVFIASMAYLFFSEFKRKLPKISVKNYIVIISLLAFGAFGFIKVTQKGKPLFGASTSNFFEAIVQDYIEWFSEYVSTNLTAITIGTIILILVILLLFLKFRSDLKFGIITIITFALIYIISSITGKPLPTQRVLLPFWPLIVLMIVEILDAVVKLFSIHRLIYIPVNILVFLLLAHNFSSQLGSEEELNKRNPHFKTRMYSNFEMIQEDEPVIQYYNEKDKYFNILPKKLISQKPDRQQSIKDFEIAYYKSKNVLLLSNKVNPEADWELYTELNYIGNDKNAIRNSHKLEELMYSCNDKYYYIIYLPVEPLQDIKIGSNIPENNWEINFSF